MSTSEDDGRRLRIAMDMRDFGIELYRQRMIRENPQAAEAATEAMVRAWLLAPQQGRILPPPPGKA